MCRQEILPCIGRLDVFFDEIHQGSGGEKQGDILNEFVFKMPYKAFIMVTATFAKPYLNLC